MLRQPQAREVEGIHLPLPGILAEQTILEKMKFESSTESIMAVSPNNTLKAEILMWASHHRDHCLLFALAKGQMRLEMTASRSAKVANLNHSFS